MRLQYFITEGSRSKAMMPEPWYKAVEKDCKKALNGWRKGNSIWRGLSQGQGDEHFVIDPKKGSARRSANTDNYYTYVITNSPQWKAYPKRTRSIICSTSQSTAQNFGYEYLVLPVDGAKLGITPIWDFWGGFDNTLTGQSGDNLDDFNWQLDAAFYRMSVLLRQNSYASFVTSMKNFDSEVKKQGKKPKDLIGAGEKVMGKVFTNFYKGNLLKALQQAFDPSKNGFKLATIGDSLPTDKEVWTDAKSYMIGNGNGVSSPSMEDFSFRFA